jgi:hypothetical protein
MPQEDETRRYETKRYRLARADAPTGGELGRRLNEMSGGAGANVRAIDRLQSLDQLARLRVTDYPNAMAAGGGAGRSSGGDIDLGLGSEGDRQIAVPEDILELA